MRKLVAAAVLLFASVAFAGEVQITVPENPVKVNSFAKATVTVEKGDQVSFQVFPTPTKREAVGNTLFLSGPPGTKYTVLVTVVNFGDEPNTKKRFDTGQVDIKIDGEKIDPDVEPDVDPKPDVEAATLTSKLKAAFKLETSDEKPLAPKLRDLYGKYANETELGKYNTYGSLETAMRKDATEYGVAGKLTETQTAVATYLVTKIPGRNPGWESVVIEPKDRKTVRVAFSTISSALEKLK